ncbi:M28 family metallopeptidase [Bacillus sp. JJ1503]|uniref:M28 family metallopeptidase n=1 Tax=Bacillus sp. JJ1503 TaxID=3122956 RepID=UPI002FFE6147
MNDIKSTNVREEIKETIRVLSEEVGQRFAGTEGEWKGTDYIYQRLNEIGVEAEKQVYPFIGWEPKGSPDLEILYPISKVLKTAYLLFSGSTPSTGISGKLTYHGIKGLIPGVYDMPCYNVLGVEGEILAQIVVNSGGDPIALLNPRSKFPIPAVVMSFEDHLHVQELLNEGHEIEVFVKVEGNIKECKSANIISHPYKSQSTINRKRVIVCAHSDTTLNTPGAYDNGSGIAGIIEIARRLRSENYDFPFDVDVIAFSNEEVGFIGADYYVNDLKERGRLDEVAAVINLDQISAGDKIWSWVGPEDFRQKVKDSFRESGAYERSDFEVDVDTPKAGADEWMFHLEGIPTALLMFWRLPDYHRPTDTIEKIEYDKVELIIETVFNLLKRIE